MAEDDKDDSQKTEDPTQKKLTEARQEGNLPLSRDMSTWFLLLGILLAVSIVLPHFMPQVVAPMTALLAKAGEIEVNATNFQAIMGAAFGAIAGPLMAILAILLLLGLTGWMVQTGPTFNVTLLRINLNKLNFITGLKKLFAFNSVFELLKGLVKVALMGYVTYILLKPVFLNIDGLIGLDKFGIIKTAHDLAGQIFFTIFLVFSAVAIGDLIYQRFTWFKNLRMTKQDVREEFRQTEGDPHIKSRIRQIRNEKARKRMMAAVPNADVVVTNPTHYAIALKYEPGKTAAPVVLAKGQDLIALKIREVAEEHKIPLVSNPPLARTLYATVEIDDEIPPQHYQAVAEIISYVLRLKRAAGGERAAR